MGGAEGARLCGVVLGDERDYLVVSGHGVPLGVAVAGEAQLDQITGLDAGVLLEDGGGEPAAIAAAGRR
jgi:hypothetical protein